MQCYIVLGNATKIEDAAVKNTVLTHNNFLIMAKFVTITTTTSVTVLLSIYIYIHTRSKSLPNIYCGPRGNVIMTYASISNIIRKMITLARTTSTFIIRPCRLGLIGRSVRGHWYH